MIVNTPQRRRAGFTLMELVVAMVASAALLVGLGSVMLIARQIAYTPVASVHRIEASQIFDELADELRVATYVTERSANSLEFVVADRSGDGVEERIRYSWSGTAGDPLLKTINGGTPAVVIQSVEELQLAYTIDTDTTTFTTTTDTAEALLARDTNLLTANKPKVRPTEWWAQQIDPAAFVSAAPANAIGWRPTRAAFLCKSRLDAGEYLLVQLRSTGDPADGPTSEVLTGVSLAAADVVDAPTWTTVSLSDLASGLPLHRKYALVWAGVGTGTNDIVELYTCSNILGGALTTVDSGASWQYLPTEQVYFRLYGRYTSPGPSYDVTRSLLSSVFVTLQTGAQEYSQVETSIPLANKPEILSAYWRADFDADPTLGDVNGDDLADWQAAEAAAGDVANPQPYDPDTLIGGVWYVSGMLTTQPLNDFAATAIVDVSFRDTVPGGSGAVVRLKADWAGSLHAPLAVRARMENDGTQTLQLTGKSDDATDVLLCERRGLSSNFIRCRLTILPDNDLVNLRVNDEDQGTFTYLTYLPSTDDRFLTLFGDTGEAEFDYADVRVLEPSE